MAQKRGRREEGFGRTKGTVHGVESERGQGIREVVTGR